MQWKGLERDEHGHIRYAEINFGELLKKAVIKRTAELGIKMNFVTKDIGYETRCASPNAFDIEYTRDLGYSAVEFLKNGGADAVITVVNGEAKPLPFSEMLDPVTKKTAVRFVNVNSVKYKIARAMMTLLTAEDFKAGKVEKLAAVTNLSVDEFTKQFNK